MTEDTRNDRAGAETTDDETTTGEETRTTMAEISHANPYTGERVGEAFVRGPTVAADGGRREATEGADETRTMAEGTDSARTMAEIDHRPPNGAEGANDAFERGPGGPV